MNIVEELTHVLELAKSDKVTQFALALVTSDNKTMVTWLATDFQILGVLECLKKQMSDEIVLKSLDEKDYPDRDEETKIETI
jgi:hypothetical protein